MDVDNDLIADFLVECHENLDRMDRDLVALEKAPQNQENLASVFRTLHTIKGTCGFFGFEALQTITHAGETLLSRLRDERLQLNREITSVLLALVDSVREILGRIEQNGREGVGDYSALMESFERLLAEPGTNGPATSRKGAEATSAPVPVTEGELPQEQDSFLGILGGSIRVDVGLLDKLMNLVGELVLTRNQIMQFTAAHKDSLFMGTSQRLNLITTELQEGVMKTRMQPIGNVWNRFPRLVRDLALNCRKQVRLQMEGSETELDKSIIEAIKDPLTHLVRNAVDHGIEAPEMRHERRKSVEGRLMLRAFHEGGLVHIEIDDDGAGIDVDRVKRKAIERGLIGREQAVHLSEQEALQLIFLPGFSTANQVTDISGRGVGMDVVKTNIERIGGVVELRSRPGQGTLVKIKIPLTLAIIPALIVTCGGDRYAIPRVSLAELVRLDGDQARRGIEWIHSTPVYRLRNSLLPLVELNRELKVEGRRLGADREAVNIVVLQADGRRFGLVVEQVIDTAEIVVKPLAKRLKGIPLFAGATILDDGKVALILDVVGLAQSSGVVTEARKQTPLPAEGVAQDRAERQTLLLCRFGKDRRAAIPLSEVDRLEEIPCTAVENAHGQEVVQYRGLILPLIRLAALLGAEETEPASGRLQAIIVTVDGRRAGLVVDRILDTVETVVDIEPSAPGEGLLGTTVIGGRVMELIDVPAVARMAGARRGARRQTLTAGV